MAIGTPLELVQDASRAAVLLDPLRLRLMEELRDPDSASGLARRLKLPRQKLNYHLRELESHGFVEMVEERRKGNCVERVMRATARTYMIDPATLGKLAADPAEIQDHFSSAYLLAVCARAIRDLAVLHPRAKKAGKKLPTMTLQTEVRFASASSQNAFAEELTREIGRLVAKYHDEQAAGGRRFQLFLGSYPTITKKDAPTGSSEEKP